MPGYKGHLVGGTVAYALIWYGGYGGEHIPFERAAELLACTLAGALFPDIDVKSKGQKLLYWFLFLLFAVLLLFDRFDLFILAAFTSLVPMMARHRGLFHKLWFNAVLAISIALLIAASVPGCDQHRLCANVLFFLAGVASHLWLDVGAKRMIKV